jgi:hypothetical protein
VESPLTDTDVQSINSEIARFNDWLATEKFPILFWNDIEPALQSLQNEIAGLTVGGFQADPFIAILISDISQALTTPPTDRSGVERIYERYVRLRVLWEERDALAALIGLAQADFSSFLDLADQREWERIKADPLQLRVPKPAGGDGLEAFQVLQFSVTASNPRIEGTYVFRHKIEYQWNLQLTLKKRWKRNTENVVLEPLSLGPSVVQYFPLPGAVSASVTLRYGNDSKPIHASDQAFIYPSSDFQPYKILAGTEVVSWVISAITAVATGLSMFYFKGTSWGTYQDYLTMFLWGMGVDQGKTFLQALQANSPPSSD